MIYQFYFILLYYYITVVACGAYELKIPAKYNKLQGIIASSYTPINYRRGSRCEIHIFNLPSRTLRLELLYSRALTSYINIGGAKFYKSNKAGATRLLTANSKEIHATYGQLYDRAIFVVKYEGKYFYKIIYKLYNNIYTMYYICLKHFQYFLNIQEEVSSCNSLCVVTASLNRFVLKG